MRGYLITLLVAYCSIIWAIFILYFVDHYEKQKKDYGDLWFLTIATTTIFSPILVAVELIQFIVGWLIGKNQNGSPPE